MPAVPLSEIVSFVSRRYSGPEVVGTFLTTRCPAGNGAWGSLVGTMGPDIDQATADRIVERANVVG